MDTNQQDDDELQFEEAKRFLVERGISLPVDAQNVDLTTSNQTYTRNEDLAVSNSTRSTQQPSILNLPSAMPLNASIGIQNAGFVASSATQIYTSTSVPVGTQIYTSTSVHVGTL